MTPISAASAPEKAPGAVGAAIPPSSSRSRRPRIGVLCMPACKSCAGFRPAKPNGYAPASRPEPPLSVMAANGFAVLPSSRASSTNATSPAPVVPQRAIPPSAGRTPCSPTSRTASWPPTAPSRPNIYRATSAPSPGASIAGLSLHEGCAVNDISTCDPPCLVGKGNVVFGSGAVLQWQQGCVTLHTVGACGSAPECLMHEVLP